MGIPIGPDTSLIIAEALLAHVDERLQSVLGGARGIRFMDEWEFAFKSVAEAEYAAAALEDQLASLELALNPEKITIREGPVPLNPSWVTALRRVPIPQGKVSEPSLVTLFDTAFELSAEQRTKGVLNWAISRVMYSEFDWAGWRSLEPLILQSAGSEPGSLPRVLRMLTIASDGGHTVHRARLEETLAAVIGHAARRAQWSEVAWSLWGHVLFDMKVDQSVFALLESTDDPIVALVALDALHRGLISGADAAQAVGRWQGLVGRPESGNERDWLLGYEANVKGWLELNNPLGDDFHYRSLTEAGVSFYRHDVPSRSLMLSHKATAPTWLTPELDYL